MLIFIEYYCVRWPYAVLPLTFLEGALLYLKNIQAHRLNDLYPHMFACPILDLVIIICPSGYVTQPLHSTMFLLFLLQSFLCLPYSKVQLLYG